MKQKKERIHYKQFCQRLDDETIEWLIKEKQKYKSWNLFFRELQKIYVEAVDK